jgi:carbonic anhydrase
MTSASIQDLFAHNRAWAAQMERERPGFFSGLTQQQRPKYMWIGCSDSRVPANQITGLEPGEVFVHRNVANVVVHSDLNALSSIQFAVDMLKVEHIIVVGHYGCGGVQAALSNIRVGLADNWIRHIQDVRDRHRELLDRVGPGRAFDALVELNVIEQVVNVCVSTVMCDAWAKGQKVSVHGWAYGVHDGLLQDLQMTVSGTESIAPVYRAALAGVVEARRPPSPFSNPKSAP